MSKFKSIFAVLVALASQGAIAQTNNVVESNRLMGLGMPGQLAAEVSSISAYLANNSWVRSRNAAGTGDLNIMRADSSDNVQINVGTGKSVKVSVALTPNVQIDATGVALQVGGQGITLASYVPTMAATPAAGTNEIKPGLNVVPTAAANTAALLGPATPVPGQQFRINNSGPNSVRIKAAGGATLNGATAGGYVVLPTLATIDCITASATNQVCLQPVVPTPAGP